MTSLQEGMFTELLRLCCVHIRMPFMVESNSETMPCRFLNATSPLTVNTGRSGKRSQIWLSYSSNAAMEVQPTATLPGIFRISFSMYAVLFGRPFPN